MRTWVNDKQIYDEEMDKQHNEAAKREQRERFCPYILEEPENGMDRDKREGA